MVRNETQMHADAHGWWTGRPRAELPQPMARDQFDANAMRSVEGAERGRFRNQEIRRALYVQPG